MSVKIRESSKAERVLACDKALFPSVGLTKLPSTVRRETFTRMIRNEGYGYSSLVSA